ncbi:MAG: PDZ domain-containing protein, partial [Spirochaetes bacterium]|nr:PDZ domain-containing protein [Spirochaetota bacterium]
MCFTRHRCSTTFSATHYDGTQHPDRPGWTGHRRLHSRAGPHARCQSSWGKKLIGKTWGGTEYRISVFPVGGYCKMKGERSYAEALENDQDAIPEEHGSFFGAAPWKRIVTLLAGPIANIILAVFILSIVWWVGFSIETYENRIVLASDYEQTASAQGAQALEEDAPADQAGLQSGDRIVAINGQDIRSYSELQQVVAQNALTTLTFAVRRDGRMLEIPVRPRLVEET